MALVTLQQGIRIAVGYQLTKLATELIEKEPTVNQLVSQLTGGQITPATHPELGSAVAASQVLWLKKIPFLKGVTGLRDFAAGGFAWGVGRFIISVLTRFGVGFPAPLRPQF